jgi:hypothetical protein
MFKQYIDTSLHTDLRILVTHDCGKKKEIKICRESNCLPPRPTPAIVHLQILKYRKKIKSKFASQKIELSTTWGKKEVDQ